MATLRRSRPLLGAGVTPEAADWPPSPYRAPRWLPGGHAQTIWPKFVRLSAVPLRRERVVTPDGDFWDFDWLDASPGAAPAPLVVLFHGLESNSRAHYARALTSALAAIGWRGVVPHFRGCGGEPNLRPRAYHSGDHEEIGAILAAVRDRVPPDTVVHAAGISLGGSALVNWLGRAGQDAAKVLSSAAAVSTPLDLTAAGLDIDRGFNRIYAWHFLATLRPKSRDIARRFPGILDEARLRGVFSMYAFDDAVTAPLHGFAGTLDYWQRASSKRWLAHVAVPTLVLNAKNDPFVPGASLPGPGEVSRDVLLEQPEEGGHCGFMVGPFPGRLTWLPQRLLQFFRAGC
jgi:predicted alpha/beta-fold hydrolase